MTRTTQRFFEAGPESVGQAQSFTSAALADLDGWGVQDRTPFGKIIWSCFKAAGGTTA